MASRDYEEFIAALNAHGVRYLIVGAHAVALHARPRATLDLDILVERTPVNARRWLKALSLFFDGASVGPRSRPLTPRLSKCRGRSWTSCQDRARSRRHVD